MIKSEIKKYNNHDIFTISHDVSAKKLVIFCHGYRSSSIGPNRTFVRLSKKLEIEGISSLRFDQYGSGNSDGDFYDSTFIDWVATIKEIIYDYSKKGYDIVIFGQSMGGATALAVGLELPDLIKGIAAWVPDLSVDAPIDTRDGYYEENGQRVQAEYWKQAHDANIANRLNKLDVPTLIIQCTNDEYVDEANRNAISNNANSFHQVVNYDGYSHSAWTYDQSEEIIQRTVGFIVELFNV